MPSIMHILYILYMCIYMLYRVRVLHAVYKLMFIVTASTITKELGHALSS